MTSLLDLDFEELFTPASKDSNHNICHQHRNVLKCKDKKYKHKCKKILKRKLKKYKLRQDGKEDQDIIDVSDTLVTRLCIRSPNKAKDSVELETEQFKRKNYLFKMVKRKQTTLKATKITKTIHKVEVQKDEVLQISPSAEERKQTNAFKLLMESRNKSIGTNSPGKERSNNEADTQEVIEKKTLKAKRALILQKMAEEKGALKKKVVEEQHEKYINKKMEKRAEKLKSMILHKEPKPSVDDKVKHTEKRDTKEEDRSPLDNIEPEKNIRVEDKSVKKLQLVNIFSETIEKKISPEKKLTKEDKEFLNKLSPSIRKKESMLSYFKKIEKEPEMSEADAENDNSIIKVKLVKPKKKGRKKKLSLNRNNEKSEVPETNIVNVEEEEILIVVEIKEEEDIVSEITNNLEIITPEVTNKERRKRKREAIENIPNIDSTLAHDNNSDEQRPKRSVKRPIKYNDDAGLTSSDEELHIFTPKKKHLGDKDKITSQTDDIILIDDKKTSKVAKKSINEYKLSKKESKSINNAYPPKPVKLAPIFSKPQPDAAAIEAKQKFLQSGVPEQLKKLMAKQKSCNTGSNIFPTVVHVQQIEATTTLPTLELPLKDDTEEISLENSVPVFSNLLSLSTLNNVVSWNPKSNVSIQTMLQNLKEAYPRFPVYRTYKLLRGKRKGEFRDSNIFSNLDNSVEILNCSIDMQTDNPDQLTWCDKYKPLSGNEIIGNFDSIRELKKWLVTWTENDTTCKAYGNDSDSSDFYQSEPDSRDSMKFNNNLLILSGPTGCGKTSAVYAVAAELSMKVIEVNSSSKRTGKIMLQDLQEATQSHKVNRGGRSSENSQKSQEINETQPEIQIKKRGRPKQSEQATPIKHIKKKTKEKAENNCMSSHECTRTAMSLILIDDADIVFDQDDGFCSAITQLVQSSKRPVILVTGSLSPPHLQKFLQCGKILKMHALLPNMLGTWLDLMCLADSGTCWPGVGAKFLNFYKGDMRKTINCLQFYVGSHQVLSGDTPIDSQSSDAKINTDDENSCMSWTDRDTDDKNAHEVCDTNSQSVWNSFARESVDLKHSKGMPKLFDMWWSLPKILTTQNISENACKVQESIESISNVLDSISVNDYLSHNQFESDANLTSRPWYDEQCDSVSELQNLDYYDRKYDTTREICRELLLGSITAAQESMGLENKYEINFPGMSIKRKRDRIVRRHSELTSYLNPQSSLDRKALALDYWSSCRDICRIEKSKTDTNLKRNNRFCHYLKSLSVLCKSDSFDNLANSLQPGL